MDSLTHIVVGACLGQAIAGKYLGRKALMWGALANSLPDIDIVTSFWMDIPSALVAHRGFSHSLLFCFMASCIIGVMANRFYRHPQFRTMQWIGFILIAALLHILIDAFNNYGVGWFVPFSEMRISFNALYVADPLFTLPPLIAVIIFLIKKTSEARVWKIGLLLPALYACYCLGNKWVMHRKVQADLKTHKMAHFRFMSTPAPFQSLLWYIVAEDSVGFRVAFHSVMAQDRGIEWTYFPKNHFLRDHAGDQPALEKLIRFSQGYYTLEQRADTLVFNDLRFGQIAGWYEPRAPFVFQYYLSGTEDNDLVVQRGRFRGWTVESLRTYFKKMLGAE